MKYKFSDCFANKKIFLKSTYERLVHLKKYNFFKNILFLIIFVFILIEYNR